ncbi:hypothetical protein EB796_025195 [Bugula neritina]|uniref:Uncharacterized protein n=1 Tax=Bugula neritina TaxID=10212 RepID=A0A7J7ISE9_BUGNE|nr:hypothetical protein EB796_025195 [Bugula neritina]
MQKFFLNLLLKFIPWYFKYSLCKSFKAKPGDAEHEDIESNLLMPAGMTLAPEILLPLTKISTIKSCRFPWFAYN